PFRQKDRDHRKSPIKCFEHVWHSPRQARRQYGHAGETVTDENGTWATPMSPEFYWRKFRAKYLNRITNSSSESISPSFSIELSVSAHSSGDAKCCRTRLRSWQLVHLFRRICLPFPSGRGPKLSSR